MDEVAKDFDVDKVSKSPAIYDIGKLNWFNRAYIAKLSHDELMTYVSPFLKFDLAKFSQAAFNTRSRSHCYHLNRISAPGYPFLQ